MEGEAKYISFSRSQLPGRNLQTWNRGTDQMTTEDWNLLLFNSAFHSCQYSIYYSELIRFFHGTLGHEPYILACDVQETDQLLSGAVNYTAASVVPMLSK